MSPRLGGYYVEKLEPCPVRSELKGDTRPERAGQGTGGQAPGIGAHMSGVEVRREGGVRGVRRERGHGRRRPGMKAREIRRLASADPEATIKFSGLRTGRFHAGPAIGWTFKMTVP